MAEPALAFVARALEKERIIEEDVAVPWEGYAARTGAARPPPYSFALEQRDLDGSALDPYGSAALDPGRPPEAEEEEGGPERDCARHREVRIPEVAWPARGDTAEAAAAAHAALSADGVVKLRGLLDDAALLRRARAYLLRRASEPDASFTEYVHLARHRHHLRLRPSEDPSVGALFEAMARSAGAVLLPLSSPLGAVVEFAAFLTNPGASGQGLHADSGNSFSGAQAPLHSLFLFLTDVDGEAHGPLQVAPRTHGPSPVRDATRWSVQRLARQAKAGDAASARCLGHWNLCPLQAGDAALYDGTGLHRGMENNSTRTRVVVYMSFLGVGSLAFGQTFAIDSTLLTPPRRLGDLLVEASQTRGSSAAREDL